jgi:hypothetical protein
VASYIACSLFVSDDVSPAPTKKNSFRIRTTVTLLCGGLVGLGCGPELTQPGTTNLTGLWISTDLIGPVSNIQVNVTQHADGTLEGRWSGKSSNPNAVCPPELGLNPTNTISGTNTVLEVQFDLLGVGSFAGQATDNATLRGSLQSCGQIYPIRFSLASSPP